MDVPRYALAAFRDAIWALTVPVFIIVGLRHGLFTPTEAGAVIVIYSVLVGFLAYRELTWSALPEILTEAALATSAVMIIISAANAFRPSGPRWCRNDASAEFIPTDGTGRNWYLPAGPPSSPCFRRHAIDWRTCPRVLALSPRCPM